MSSEIKEHSVQHPPGEPARSLRISIIEGCFAMINIAISTGALLTAYAVMLGASFYHFSLMFGLTALSSVGHLFGSRLVGLLASRRKITVFASVGGRLIWCILCALPFIDLLPGWRLGAFLTVVFVSSITANIANNAWLSWMADLVPEDTRGAYFGKRNMIHSLVSMGSALSVGYIYDSMKAAGMELEAFVCIYAFASLMILISGLVLWRQWEPPAHHEKQLPISELLRIPFANIRFRYLLVFYIYWHLAAAVSSPFFQPFMINDLRMSQLTIAVYGLIAGLISIILQPVWGRIIDRVGSKPVLIINMIGVCGLPLFWLFPRPDFLMPIWVDAFLTGIFWPGFNLATLTLIIGIAPKENRSAYIASYSMVVGITSFFAAMLGGVIMDLTARFHLVLFGLTFVNYHIIYVLTSFARLAMVPMALGIKDDKSHSMQMALFIINDKVSQIYTTSLQSITVILKRLKP